MAVGESVFNSLMAPSGIPGDLPVVFSLDKYRGSVWWTKYFSRSYGIEIENNSVKGGLPNRELQKRL